MPRLPLAMLLLFTLWVTMHAAPLIPVLELDSFRNAIAPMRRFSFTIDGVARWAACYMIFAELVRASASPRWFHAWFAGGLVITLLFRVTVMGQSLHWNELLGLLVALPLILVAPCTGKPAWAVLLALILCAGLSPFRFNAPEHPFRWLILDYAGLMQKAFLCIGTAWIGHRAGVGRFKSVVAAVIVFATIEYLQKYMPGRAPELADPLLALSAILILERK